MKMTQQQYTDHLRIMEEQALIDKVNKEYKQCCLSCGCYHYTKHEIPIDADPYETLCPSCWNHYEILRDKYGDTETQQ